LAVRQYVRRLSDDDREARIGAQLNAGKAVPPPTFPREQGEFGGTALNPQAPWITGARASAGAFAVACAGNCNTVAC
jgi:hypothetical protein